MAAPQETRWEESLNEVDGVTDDRLALQPPTKKCIDKLGSYARTAGVGTTRPPLFLPHILASGEPTRFSRDGDVAQLFVRSLGDGNGSAPAVSSKEHQPHSHEAEGTTKNGP